MARKSLLLVDPHSLFRRTVAGVARELQLAEVHEASTPEAGRRLLEARAIDALLLDLGDPVGALALVQAVRDGAFGARSDLPIALTAETCDLATIALYKELGVQRIMLKPFKVKTVLEVVQNLAH